MGFKNELDDAAKRCDDAVRFEQVVADKSKDGDRDFAWESAEWWEWLNSHRRRPTISALTNYLDSFTGFIAFHGCRTSDVASYYSRGLIRPSHELLNDAARTVFRSPGIPPVEDEHFEEVLRESYRWSSGMVYVVIDQRDFIEHCGHYLIYGSEHLCSIGAALRNDEGFDYRNVLKWTGTPTLFRCRLTRQQVTEEDLKDLARHVRDNVWPERKETLGPPAQSWTFILHDSLPPQCIVDHTHPEVIPDPLHRRTPYRFRDEVGR